ncbi:MAG: SCP2 sterol-binding domain-containing protein [Pikeienuella sp.]
MFTEDDIPQEMRDRVATAEFENILKFDCGDDGVLVINRDQVGVVDMDADCTIKVSKKNLKKLMTGKISPTVAFMTGKVKIEGDMSVALQMTSLL